MVHILIMYGSEWKWALNNGELSLEDGGSIGRQYFFYLGNNNNANGGFIHHRYMQGSNWNSGPPDAYRVSPLAWTMVTVITKGIRVLLKLI